MPPRALSSLSARITLGFLILVVTFGGISVWTVVTLQKLNQVIRITNAGYVQLALVSADLDSNQVTLRGYLREELGEEKSPRLARKRLERMIAGRERHLSRSFQILEEVGSLDGVAPKQFVGTESLIQSIAELVDGSKNNYEVLLANPPISLPDGVQPSEAYQAAQKVMQEQLRVELQLARLSEKLKNRESRMALGLSDKLDEVFRETWKFTLLFGAFAVILGVALTFGASVMLRPLQRLRIAAGRIASGDYAQRISVKGPREIAELAAEFNLMGEAIEAHSRELVRTERLATAGKMAAMITHEVRNPLSSIGLNTELLEEECSLLPKEEGDEAKALCQAITREVDRLTEITEGYLQLTRLPTPKRQLERIETVVQDLVAFVSDPMLRQGARIATELPEEGPKLFLDEDQIRQALLNLLRNAADASTDQREGKIVVRVVHNERESLLEVQDDGPGIPLDKIDRVFEAFVSSKSGGTGLGLALTQEVVSAHGALIEAHNAAEGGALFRIRFPRPQPGAELESTVDS